MAPAFGFPSAFGCGENTATYTATGGTTPTFVLVTLDRSGNPLEQQFVWQQN